MRQAHTELMTGRFRLAQTRRWFQPAVTVEIELCDDQGGDRHWRPLFPDDLTGAVDLEIPPPIARRRAIDTLTLAGTTEPIGDPKQAAYNALALGLARVMRARILSVNDENTVDEVLALNELLKPFEPSPIYSGSGRNDFGRRGPNGVDVMPAPSDPFPAGAYDDVGYVMPTGLSDYLATKRAPPLRTEPFHAGDFVRGNPGSVS